VDYEFQITRTEVTVAQWFEFVTAYAPYYTGSPNDPAFTSMWISPSGSGTYQMAPGSENFPADVSWRMAARFCNWHSNGRQNTQAAFETGAYDASTFTTNPDLTYNDQIAHSPGASHWISTQDEWTKAMHYDPDRYGSGQGGYWINPAGGEEPLISGDPWEGGQTNGGIPSIGQITFLPVGSYPDVTSPWGLVDGSGGLREWTETDYYRQSRAWVGSMWFEDFYWWTDRLDQFGGTWPWVGGQGFRVSTIPAPGTTACVVFGLGLLARRRRR
jgi:formylglycine-generating enzyme required for sulfatase activity